MWHRRSRRGWRWCWRSHHSLAVLAAQAPSSRKRQTTVCGSTRRLAGNNTEHGRRIPVVAQLMEGAVLGHFFFGSSHAALSLTQLQVRANTNLAVRVGGNCCVTRCFDWLWLRVCRSHVTPHFERRACGLRGCRYDRMSGLVATFAQEAAATEEENARARLHISPEARRHLAKQTVTRYVGCWVRLAIHIADTYRRAGTVCPLQVQLLGHPQ